jgi:hypothetical protein
LINSSILKPSLIPTNAIQERSSQQEKTFLEKQKEREQEKKIVHPKSNIDILKSKPKTQPAPAAVVAPPTPIAAAARSSQSETLSPNKKRGRPSKKAATGTTQIKKSSEKPAGMVVRGAKKRGQVQPKNANISEEEPPQKMAKL